MYMCVCMYITPHFIVLHIKNTLTTHMQKTQEIFKEAGAWDLSESRFLDEPDLSVIQSVLDERMVRDGMRVSGVSVCVAGTGLW
jgi:hypothetical protein